MRPAFAAADPARRSREVSLEHVKLKSLESFRVHKNESKFELENNK